MATQDEKLVPLWGAELLTLMDRIESADSLEEVQRLRHELARQCGFTVVFSGEEVSPKQM